PGPIVHTLNRWRIAWEAILEAHADAGEHLVALGIDAGIVVIILRVAILALHIDLVGKLHFGTRAQTPAIGIVRGADVGRARHVTAVELGVGVAALGVDQRVAAHGEADARADIEVAAGADAGTVAGDEHAGVAA
ncbi:hypothetical protein QT22_00345, partial [Staphylococcus aureus]